MRFRARQIKHRDRISGSKKYPDPDPIMVKWAISRKIAVTPDLNLDPYPFQQLADRKGYGSGYGPGQIRASKRGYTAIVGTNSQRLRTRWRPWDRGGYCGRLCAGQPSDQASKRREWFMYYKPLDLKTQNGAQRAFFSSLERGGFFPTPEGTTHFWKVGFFGRQGPLRAAWCT